MFVNRAKICEHNVAYQLENNLIKQLDSSKNVAH